MNRKEYTNFEDINHDLKILKIEQEIALSNIVLETEKTKREVRHLFRPLNIIKSTFVSFTNFKNSGSFKETITDIGINYLLKKLNLK